MNKQDHGEQIPLTERWKLFFVQMIYKGLTRTERSLQNIFLPL